MAAILVSYDDVRDVLIAQRVELLRSAASSHATVLVDRLNSAERIARSMGDDTHAGRLSERDAMERYFRSVVAIERAGSRVLYGTPSRLPTAETIALGGRPLAAGAGKLVVMRETASRASIWLVVGESAATRVQRQLALELDPAFLWAAGDLSPFLTEICILETAGLPLACDHQPPLAVIDTLRKHHPEARRTDFSWERNGVRYLSGVRELFLTGRFGGDTWLVVATQPEDHALAPVNALASLVIPVVLLGLLVAALLGLVHVRRALRPLAELAGAAGRVAARDFEVRVPVARDDEFGVLAKSFNAMSGRLGRQFKALQAQSEIDAVILSTADLKRVVDIVLRRVSELVNADRYHLLLVDPSGTYRLYSITGKDSVEDREVSVSWEDTNRLRAAVSGLRVVTDDVIASPAFGGIQGANLFLLSFMLGNELGGAFVLGYDESRGPDGEEVSMLWKLGDRIAVALATARRDLELHRRAYYDSLTNLPNRLLGLEELTRAVASAARHRRGLAVLFVDLDGFSGVNDSLGHAAGDAVLVQSARRLQGCVRKADIVARLAGDEFAIMLPDLRGSADAALVARHVIKALSAVFELTEGRVHVSASVGIALFPGDGDTAEELLKHADLAMYHAKQQGSGRIVFFETSMNEEVRRRTELERELRIALDEGQLRLYYQPQLDMKSGRIVGGEGLIRWIHPTRGLVAPAQFIEFAETSGLIDAMGQWVLKTACAQLVAWRTEGLPIDYVSVNVSPRQFHTEGFSETVAEALQAFGIPASALHLELTESAVLGDQTVVRANLERLGSLGTPLELDDFGTGYSSLAHLKHLPVSGVKLDRAFIKSIHEDPSALAVVRAAIDMAHALGKIVVAEGVELAEQAALLAQMGCDVMQGFHLSAAVPADNFAALVRQRIAATPVSLQPHVRH